MGKTKIKDLTDEEYLHHGSLACAGCGALLAFRHALKALGPNTITINSTGCMAVIMQMGVPKVPHFHVLFENGPAVMSGVEQALDIMGKRGDTNLLVVVGDGGTADIGMGSLSGAVERGHDFIYLCYDNESYMNTGGQRSGTTPFGAATTTTPVGSVVKGETRPMEMRKDVPEIMIAHGAPYVATASIGYPLDLIDKVKKAATVRGPSYVHVFASCPAGWRSDAKDSVKLAKLAVQTGLIVLFEHENGERTFQHLPKKRKPLREYLELQGRFKHLLDDEDATRELEDYVEGKFKAIEG
ncbi:MAG: pyruvate synthase subunit beta [Thermoplasmata archaeon]|nr:pyruvate synthase subunit beta [Thermoplasmata archaeon]